METSIWTTTSIRKLFRWDSKKSSQNLFNAEERGDIPKAYRMPRGSIQIRQWTEQQLPEIGRKFGFLKPISTQKVITIYSPKCGVLKTTFGFNLG